MQTRAFVFVILMGLGLTAETELEKASRLLKNRHHAESQAMLERVIQADPRNAEALVMLGEVHLRLHNPIKAQDCANKALQLDPTQASPHCLKANALSMQIGQVNMFKKLSMASEIRAGYETALKLDPRYSNARQGLFQFYLQAPGIVGGGMEKAAAERRLMVWSADDAEQALLARTGIAGDFLADPESLGIFLNDGSGSKIGYYIDSSYEVVNRVCEDGSLEAATVTVTLTHAFGGDVASLPPYVNGDGNFVPQGEFHANVIIYTPVGIGVTKLSRDGEAAGMVPDLHNGRTMAQVRVALKPGQTTTLLFDLGVPADAAPADHLVVTPGSRPGALGTTITTVEDRC